MATSNRNRYYFGGVISLLFLALLILHVARQVQVDEIAIALFVGVIGGAAFALSEKLGIKKITAGSLSVETIDAALEVAKSLPASQRVHLPQVRQKHADLFPVIGARFLWVDDCPEELLIHRQVLRRLGVDVVTSRSTEEAKDQLKRDGDFALVVQDNIRATPGDSHALTEWIDSA